MVTKLIPIFKLVIPSVVFISVYTTIQLDTQYTHLVIWVIILDSILFHPYYKFYYLLHLYLPFHLYFFDWNLYSFTQKNTYWAPIMCHILGSKDVALNEIKSLPSYTIQSLSPGSHSSLLTDLCLQLCFCLPPPSSQLLVIHLWISSLTKNSIKKGQQTWKDITQKRITKWPKVYMFTKELHNITMHEGNLN